MPGEGRVFRSLDEAFAAYEERYGGDGETIALHAKIKVRMPAGKFAPTHFPRASEDGTPNSIVLREYGSNLICARYRYDAERRQRIKTVELVVDRVQ